MVVPERFFDETTDQSVVKAEIVEKYFDAWASIIIGARDAHPKTPDGRIAYVDLFAGPGRYKDGAASTPLKVLRKAIEKPEYSQRLVTIFNDKDEANARMLEGEIAKLRGIERLQYRPEVWNKEVGDQVAREFERINTIPILAFIDPWGYKGLTLQLVNAFLKNWGCDCLFFFNYARINAGLSNPEVREHMAALFGDERSARLSEELRGVAPRVREATIVEELAAALREHAGGAARFVLPFCFKNATGTRTTHHLVLVTKHFKGYDVMKEVMARASSKAEDGVPSFAFSPATGPEQRLLFQLNSPLENLRGSLLTQFAGRTLTAGDIYRCHSVDTPYLRRNYKQVLSELEAHGAVRTSGRKSRRGFSDSIYVTFPAAG